MVFDKVPSLTIRRRAYSNVQPWTMEDGLTNQEILSDLVRYIRDELIPFIRDGLDDFVSEVVEELQSRLDQVIALIEEAQQLHDDVAVIAADSIAEITRIRDEAMIEMIAARDAAEQYRDQAAVSATDAGDAADAAEQISDAMQALYDEAQAVLADIEARYDELATRERSVQLALGAVIPEPIFNRVRRRAETGQDDLRIVALGSSTAQGYKASSTADVFNRVSRRAKITDIAPLGTSRVNKGSFRNGSIGGSRSNNFVNSTILSDIKSFDPHYVFVVVGSNDANGSVPVATYRANMVTACNQIKAQNDAALVLVHSQGRAGVTQALWDSYRDALESVAEEVDAVFIDATAHERFNRAGNNSAGMLQDDGTHLTDSGHRYLADIISAEIGLPIPPDSRDAYIGVLEGRGPSTTDFRIYTLELPAAQVPRIVTVNGVAFLRYEGDSSGEGTPALWVGVNGTSLSIRCKVEDMPGSFPFSTIRYVPAGEAIEVGVTVNTNARFISSSDQPNYSRIGVTVESA